MAIQFGDQPIPLANHISMARCATSDDIDYESPKSATEAISKASNSAYSRLPHNDCYFRILTLKPAETRDAEINCTTAVHSFDDDCNPPYSALSYTWGKKEEGDPKIALNNTLITVTRNLDQALRYIRSKDEETTWWIDQLCIDQKEKDEKTAQVSRMKQIFSSAKLVNSWVGEAGTDFQQLKNFIKEHQSILRRNELRIQGRPRHDEINEKDPTKKHQSTSREDESRIRVRIKHDDIYEKDIVKRLPGKMVMPVIKKFFNDRQYWSRLWVIEEVVLAQKRRIRCGDEDMDISELRQLLEAQKKLLVDFSLNWFSTFGMSARSERRLHEALIVAWNANTTKAVDRIYGVLGLVTHGEGRMILPNYNLTACAVYCKAVTAIFQDLISEEGSEYVQKEFKQRIREKCAHDPFTLDSTLASNQCQEGVGHFDDLFHRFDGMIGLKRLWIKVSTRN